MKTKSDRNVVILAMEGKEEAFNELYQRYHKLAYFIALKVCGNEADAQDVVQEAFIAIQANISKLQEPDAFKGWMSKIVVTKCQRLFRKNYRVNRYAEKLNENDFLYEHRKDFIPSKQQRFQTDQEVLTSLLDELSCEQRLVIVLFYFQQLSLNEIVEMTDIPLGTVKSRLSYARKALFNKIQLYEEENQEKLSFQGFDMLVVALFADAFAIVKLPKILLPIKLPKSRFLHNPASLIAIASSSIVAVVGVSAAVALSDTSSSPPPQNEVPQVVNVNTEKFEEVSVKNEVIDNARDAYFILILWAYDEEELKLKSLDEIASYATLYEELKRFGGEYFQLLDNRNWSDTFESINNTKIKGET